MPTEHHSHAESAAHSRDSDEAVIDLRFLRALWRDKFIILAFGLVAMLAGAYYAYNVATPIYSATAQVMRNNQTSQIVDLPSVIGELSNDSNAMGSEIQVIQSRVLLGDVVDQLNLVEDPEFNGRLREPSLKVRIKSAIMSWFSSEQPSSAAPPDEEVVERAIRDSVISALRAHLNVRNLPTTSVFNITVTSESPQKAAMIADTIARQYVQDQIDVKRDSMKEAIVWLTDQVGQLQQDLEQSEIRVSEFQSANPMITPEVLAGLQRQLSSVRDRLETTRAEARDASARLALLQNAESYSGKAAVSGNARLEELSATASFNAADAAEFDRIYSDIVTDAQANQARQSSNLTALQNSETRLSDQIERQGQELIQLQQLTREAEANRLLYQYFLGRLKETSAQQGIQKPDSRIIAEAVVPGGPIEPRKSFILVIYLAMGLGLGVAVTLLRESRKRVFHTAPELEQATGEQVLGQVPLISVNRRRKFLSYFNEHGTSAAAEAIRNLRTSILLSNVDTDPQIIMVTSALPGEGKTSISLTLALNMTGLSKRVLVMEGDIRRRALGEYFDLDQEKGLMSVLGGTASLDDVIQRSDEFGFDILGSGKTTANAADVVSSQNFNNLLTELRSRYDHIIIDTPPLLIVPDSRIVAKQVDRVVMVVKWNQTSRSQLFEALDMIESVNAKVDGLVLNQISASGMKRYGYGDSYGSYYAYSASGYYDK
ncbi:GumC family protein [Martelella radicis]|uniref:non-specific protein-tyrosine kinase n=1 Tax=Martelella radicis TaxID=1397476 RepID=A0A7W6P9V5_9HYPH|nr:polysaccharide biosynthesis tyrosine autokinase [Martelella radicis]MBB4122707.1 capsular exopolysaccharide synthesis family protein [Martelella radicis]